MKEDIVYICPQTKTQCDDECCVSAEDCHAEAINSIISNCEPEQLNKHKMKTENLTTRTMKKQTWIDTYLGRFKWYRKLRKGTWYKRSFNDNAYQLRLISYSDYWTRYGGRSSYCEVIEIETFKQQEQ